MKLLRVCCWLVCGALLGDIRQEPEGVWAIRSGPVECRLRREGQGVALEYFGPAGGERWKPAAEVAEGSLVSHEVRALRAGVDELRLVFRHARLPLEIAARHAAWGDTGVITRQVSLRNTSGQAVRVEAMPSVAWRLPAGEYDLTYLWGGWGQERQVATERLGAGRRAFVSSRGRSTSVYSPWFALRNEALMMTYVAQLAWSGNWEMSFERLPGRDRQTLAQQELAVEMAMRFDGGGPVELEPGRTLELPAVAFTASAGDLDDAANQLHRYQRRFVLPRTPANDPLLVQFNSWYPFPGKLTAAEMKRCAEIAAKLGAEVFVLDSGWYNKENWSRELGDYRPEPAKFPNGLQELARHVRSLGMKFGLWVEIENVGIESETFRRHPEWLLAYNGKPVERGPRRHLDFARPEVRRWARETVDRLVRDYGLEWIKIDYNIDVGEQFDGAGDALYRHLMSYYAWLDEVRAAHPGLVIENCSSGGLRFDLGIMAHTHTTWLSDVVEPVASLQLGYGCTLEFTPEACNHWMVGDGDGQRASVDLTRPAAWWDFLFRAPMNGQWGISSQVFGWNEALLERAQENVALYKKIRGLLRDADVYHLTPAPAHNNPTGWMAVEYVSEDRKHSVVMAYRLGQSTPQQIFTLRGGRRLTVSLDAEWRAAVIDRVAAQ